MMATAITSELTIEPILQYPRLVAVDTAFLLTIDLKPQQFGDTWAYPDLEEIPIRCIINPGVLFRVEFLGEPVVIVHRYGGTYSPARFLLTPEPKSLNQKGKIRITLANRFGVPMTALETEEIGVQESVSAENLITLALGRKPIEWFTEEVESVTVTLVPLETFSYEVRILEEVESRNLLLQKRTKIEVRKQRKEGQQFVEQLNAETRLEMVFIPAGTFMMGSPKSEKDSRDSERPQHEVSVPAFLMGKYPITQKQWRIVAAMPQIERELNPDPSEFKGDNLPVENVSWLDVVEFCARLSEYTGREYRIPSEAEWEYGCRAGTTTAYYFGDDAAELENYAWYYKNSGSKTHPVGEKPPNAFGLHDMHGEVWEWCADDWHSNYTGAPTDGRAWIDDNDNRSQNDKLLRGGSWINNARYCRSACRGSYDPRDPLGSYGFRVVCVLQ